MSSFRNRDDLSDAERRFVTVFVGEGMGDVKTSAKIAGLSLSRAKKMLETHRVVKAIEMEVAKDPILMSKEDYKRKLQSMFIGTGEFSEWSPAQRLKAAELLGKAGGYFLSTVEIKGQIAHAHAHGMVPSTVVPTVALPHNNRGALPEPSEDMVEAIIEEEIVEQDD